jgi:hypothetical protein
VTDDEPKIIKSPLSQKFTRDGITVSVEIFRMEGEAEWSLEVVDAEWASTVWDGTFPTDKAAYDQFISDVEREGLATVISGSQPPSLN